MIALLRKYRFYITRITDTECENNLEKQVQTFNKINGNIRRHFGKEMTSKQN
jgi:hypothetical protein